jgi:hypothetical protein
VGEDSLNTHSPVVVMGEEDNSSSLVVRRETPYQRGAGLGSCGTNFGSSFVIGRPA